MRLQFENLNTNKLHEELIENGISPMLVESKDNLTWITIDDSQIDAVNAVVAVHDPTPIPVIDDDAELYAAIEAATTVAALKSALLGGMDKSKAKVKATK